MALISHSPQTFIGEPTPGMVRGHWSLTDNNLLLRAIEHSFNRSLIPLNPKAAWSQSYDAVLCGPMPFEKKHWIYLGWTELTRVPQSDGSIRLHSLEEHLLGPDIDLEWQRIEREVHCRDDLLSTIPVNRTWNVRTTTLGQADSESRPYSRAVEQSVIREFDGALFRERKIGNLAPSKTILPGGLAVTTSMGVIDACHRNLDTAVDFPAFGIFKNATAWFDNQVLKPVAPSCLLVNGEEISLRGFVQTGRGHLPTFYWFDDLNRMIAMRQGILALIANQNPVLKGGCPHDA